MVNAIIWFLPSQNGKKKNFNTNAKLQDFFLTFLKKNLFQTFNPKEKKKEAYLISEGIANFATWVPLQKEDNHESYIYIQKSYWKHENNTNIYTNKSPM